MKAAPRRPATALLSILTLPPSAQASHGGSFEASSNTLLTTAVLPLLFRRTAPPVGGELPAKVQFTAATVPPLLKIAAPPFPDRLSEKVQLTNAQSPEFPAPPPSRMDELSLNSHPSQRASALFWTNNAPPELSLFAAFPRKAQSISSTLPLSTNRPPPLGARLPSNTQFTNLGDPPLESMPPPVFEAVLSLNRQLEMSGEPPVL